MKKKVVKLVPHTQRTLGATADKLRELACQLERGELVSVVAFSFDHDGSYSIHGGACKSRHQLLGMLIEAAIERTMQCGTDEGGNEPLDC